MKKEFMVLALAGTLTLGGCNYNGQGTKEHWGTGIGAILGGVAGAQFGDGKGQLVAVGAGTLIGALIGQEVGKSLDKADMVYAERALGQAHEAPVGETITWSNPESGNKGTITPVREGNTQADGSGNYCREYQQTIVVDGKAETAFGTACRQPDGTWRLMNG